MSNLTKKYLFGAKHPATEKPILIVLNQKGYAPSTCKLLDDAVAVMIAEQGPEVTDAATAGAMFGWHIKAAAAAIAYASKEE